MVNGFAGSVLFELNLSPFYRWAGALSLVWAVYEAWQAIRTREGVAEVKWWVLGLGLAAFLHVPHYLTRVFVQWKMGVDITEYYTPHLDAFAKIETTVGVGLIVLGMAMFAFETKRRAASRPSTGA
jgi:hypothetical protein